jgi:RNA polymerase sigma-70 factor (ECF subfamily)
MTVDASHHRFVALMERHRKIVHKVASLYCWHAEDRRDLEQDITMQVWRAFPSYDEGRPFPTWMYRIALNVAISSARKAGLRAKHSTSLEASGLDPAGPDTTPQESDPRLDVLYRVMRGLDPMNRALVMLYLEEYSYSDIADVLGISETNVATKLSRLKQQLRRDVTAAMTR